MHCMITIIFLLVKLIVMIWVFFWVPGILSVGFVHFLFTTPAPHQFIIISFFYLKHYTYAINIKYYYNLPLS